jgi:agmatine deiminase
MSRIAPEYRRLLSDYRMPAEWEPHLATYLVWPHNRDTWPGKFEVIPPIFAQMAAAIAQFEPVRILVKDENLLDDIRAMVATAAQRQGNSSPTGRIELLVIPTDDSWIRDYGPIFVNRGSGAGRGPMQLALDWRFNSWGEKYGGFALDDAAPGRLAKYYGFKVLEAPVVLEGGSIDVDGAGALLTTESCLLNPNRNPDLHREEIEDCLKARLGVSRVLWLGDGIAGDDTDGHIDDLARFAARDTVVTVIEDDPADENYRALRDNLERLRAMRDCQGHPFRIETLPMPPPGFYQDRRLPASYANFYIVNGGVLMPTFGCPADARAQSVLEKVFPGRRIVGIPSVDLVWGLGSVHCLTQQHPMPPPG